jgi:hypothetical protein
MSAPKRKVGRPLKFESPEAMERLIHKYFQECKPTKPEGPPPTMAGLAYALDTNRQTLLDYANKDEFSDAINKARNRVEVYLEQRLDEGQVAGTIFSLKNNFVWQDVQNIEKKEERTTRVITADESKV